jgi:glucokinase
MAAIPATSHLGIDLGATNIKWSVVGHEADAWAVLDRGQEPTLGNEGPAAVVERLAAVGQRAVATWPAVRTVGIGVPGRFDPIAGTVRFLVNVPGDWDGRAVGQPVGATLGLPVALLNDARAFGLAELRLGAGRGARSMVGLTLGTGVGGVIAIDGRLHEGHDGSAGEIGHHVIEVDGRPCRCGSRGCLETFVSSERIAELCGTRSARAGVEAARAGDRRAAEGLATAGRYLGIGIANLITLVTPDKVVIGGGIAAAGELLLAPIRAELAHRVTMTALDDVELVLAQLGTWAGAIGAAVHGAERAEGLAR